MGGILIYPANSPDKKGRFEVFEVFDEAIFGHMRGFGKVLKAQFLAGIIGKCVEETVQLLDIRTWQSGSIPAPACHQGLSSRKRYSISFSETCSINVL